MKSVLELSRVYKWYLAWMLTARRCINSVSPCRVLCVLLRPFPCQHTHKKKKTRLSSVVYSGFFSLQGPSSLMTPCNISKLTEARLSSAVFHRARSRRLPPVHAAFQRLVQVLEPNSHFGLKGLFGGAGFCSFVVNEVASFVYELNMSAFMSYIHISSF